MTASGQGFSLMFCQVNNNQRARDKNQRQRGRGKKKPKNVSCSSREKQRHERIYRKGDIVGKSSSHHSKKGKSREWLWVWRWPSAMRGKSKQLP